MRGSSNSKAGRQPGLDAVRSAAILLVMLHHFRWLPGAPGWFRWFALRGYVGVDLFFVLSGWLIGGQLIRELRTTGGLRVGRFWARRWLRTLPAYYAVLAGLAACGRVPPGELSGMLLFAQNYLDPGRWLVSWSLCVEEHFYLALPLVVLAARRLGRPGVLAVAAAALAASPLLRWAAFAGMAAGSYGDFLGGFYSPTHLRLEGLALGVAAAAFAQQAPASWARLGRRAGWLCAAGALLVAAATWNPALTGWTGEGAERMAFFPAVAGFFAVSAGTALMLPLASRPGAGAGMAAAPFVWIAEHAYALYLTHEFVPELIRWALPGGFGFGAQLSIAFAAAFALAAVLRRAVELPGLGLRDRLLSRAPPLTSAMEVAGLADQRGRR